MIRPLFLCFMLTGCGGLSWNTTVADHPQVRRAMLASVVPGSTTEKGFVTRWGNPTQKIREGAQTTYVYRNMKNPDGYHAPQFGNSRDYVIVTFQYGLAVGAYSSDGEGCRATFAPRPPGQGFDNPTTHHWVNCGRAYNGSSESHPIADGLQWLQTRAREGSGSNFPPGQTPLVTADTYQGTLK